MDLVVPTRWQRARTGLSPWVVAATVTGLGQLVLDVLRARMLAPGISLSSGALLALACGHLVVPLLALVLGGLAFATGRLVASTSERRWIATTVLPACVLAAALSWPLLRAGVGLASGAWISEQSFAPLVRGAPLVAGIGAAPILCAIAFHGFAPPGWRRRALVFGLFAISLALTAVDHRVAPGLYPEFHMLAYAGSSISAMLGVRHAISARPQLLERTWSRRVTVGMAAALAVAPVLWFTTSSRVRAELLLYSPVARDWIRTVMPQRKATPLRIALEDLDVSAGTFRAGTAAAPRGLVPGARDMNVLFVVVDAMRSDAIPPARPAAGTAFSEPGDTPFLDGWVEGAFRFSRCYAGATVTHLSMPSMMRSIQPFEDPDSTGESLGARLEQLGYSPLAVVVEYFLASKYPEATALLDGFDDVVVYEKKDNGVMLSSTREMLERTKGQRFFAWLHFYNLHDPGYDGEILGARDGTRVERYRRSLKWLDGQMRGLVEMLEELGLRENTIIVLAADHGEGLGDHGQSLHGPTVFEHDVRVPLVIEIPGMRGSVIDDVVGNIDIIPTIVDLVGGSLGPEDRGVSLVPYVAAAAGTWQPEDDSVLAPRDYYFRNRAGDTVGIVSGPDKLVLEHELDVAYRFDVVADPGEQQNLHDPESTIDRDLMRRLMIFNPELVADELDDEVTLDLLAHRLEDVDAQAPGAALPFLLRVAALHPTKDAASEAVRIFDEASDPDLRLLVLRHGFTMRRKAFDERVGTWIEEIADTPQELEIVAALARQGQPTAAGSVVVGRLAHWAEHGDADAWEPYLALVAHWRKSARYFEPPFVTMLRRAEEVQAPVRVLELLLDNVASTKFEAKATPATLQELTRPLLTHEDPRVRVAALRAVTDLADTESLPKIRTTLAAKDEDIRVRREAATALAKLAGAEAVDDLVAVGDDSGLAMVVVRRLGAIGSPDALPWLKQVERKHYNRFLRRAATGAIAAIEKASGATPKKRKKKPRVK